MVRSLTFILNEIGTICQILSRDMKRSDTGFNRITLVAMLRKTGKQADSFQEHCNDLG